MYSCPTDDIHSIYFDGELPLSYARDYEEHLKNCKTCSEKLDKFKKMKELFKADEKSITPDSQFLDESYKRLMTKMSYSKNTRFVHEWPVSKIVTGVAAAAAVLVAVILPVKLLPSKSASASSVNVAQLVPVERPQTTSISNKNIVINGNINDNLAQTVSTGALKNTSLADVDVFRPDFHDSNTIKITVPGMNAQTSGMNSGLMEVRMPANTISGLLP